MWIGNLKLDFSVLHDPGMEQGIVKTVSVRENAFLIERDTMKVLQRQVGGVDKLYAKLDTL